MSFPLVHGVRPLLGCPSEFLEQHHRIRHVFAVAFRLILWLRGATLCIEVDALVLLVATELRDARRALHFVVLRHVQGAALHVLDTDQVQVDAPTSVVVGHHDAVGGGVLVVPLGEGLCLPKEVCPVRVRALRIRGGDHDGLCVIGVVEEPVGLRVEESVTGDDVLPVADGAAKRLGEGAGVGVVVHHVDSIRGCE